MTAANTTDFRRSVTEAMRSLGPRLQVQQISKATPTPEAPIEQVVRERLYGKRGGRT
ncbi:MAG TPA: hypothetical protein VFY04_05590 [Solirubrobacterales bacterium]|nr:hypothetical protein [Solirubrobacterales bacterium]